MLAAEHRGLPDELQATKEKHAAELVAPEAKAEKAQTEAKAKQAEAKAKIAAQRAAKKK